MPHFTFDEVDAALGYDPETGIFTRKRLGKFAAKKYLGKPTGYKHSSGCVFVSINKKKLKAHRVAWLLQTGEWPADEIDHINGNPSDNRWANLRAATRSQNNWNTGTPKHNTSGIKGVGFLARSGKWRANISAYGQARFLGHFDTAEEAAAAYRSAALILHGEFVRS